MESSIRVIKSEDELLLREVVAKYGPFLTRNQAAEVLQVSTDTLDRWKRQGLLRAVHIKGKGGVVRFRADDILAMVDLGGQE